MCVTPVDSVDDAPSGETLSNTPVARPRSGAFVRNADYTLRVDLNTANKAVSGNRLHTRRSTETHRCVFDQVVYRTCAKQIVIIRAVPSARGRGPARP